MILWLLLFLLVIGISFVLAFRSMKDYQEIPQKITVDYSLFLVRQSKNFDAKILDSIRQAVFAQEGIVSLERLFKGTQTVLTVFGPKAILSTFQTELNLLELEDYAKEFTDSDVFVWEMGTRETVNLNPDHLSDFFSNLPQLEPQERFFWQVIPNKDQVQIRAAVFSTDPVRKKMLASAQSLNAVGLHKVPTPFSNEQMIEFYRTRSLSKDSKGPILGSEGIIRLLTI